MNHLMYAIPPHLQLYGKMVQNPAGFISGQLELTSACYQQCLYCASWRQHADGSVNAFIDPSSVIDLLVELSKIPSFEHLTLTGGDPQTYPRKHLEQILDMHATLKDVYSPTTFKLQANTALARPWELGEAELWRESFHDIRISIDGATDKTYQHARGDTKNTVLDILDRIEELAHPNYAVLMVVTPSNVYEMLPLFRLLNKLKNRPRKIIFLPAIGETDPGNDDLFVSAYYSVGDMCRTEQNEGQHNDEPIEISVNEDIFMVRDVLSQAETSEVGCYTGLSTFHIKSDGDVYPCCLVGGEALKTRTEFVTGNINHKTITEIFNQNKNAGVGNFYDKKCKSTCNKICQYKQFNINLAGHRASKTTLAMP